VFFVRVSHLESTGRLVSGGFDSRRLHHYYYQRVSRSSLQSASSPGNRVVCVILNDRNSWKIERVVLKEMAHLTPTPTRCSPFFALYWRLRSEHSRLSDQSL